MTKPRLKNSFKTLIISQILMLGLGGILLLPMPAKAVDALVISQVKITYTDQTATITWTTNRPATGKVMYGLYSNNYTYSLQTNQSKTDQAITIFGLFPETDYFLKITATDGTVEISSFEQQFKTKVFSSAQAPTISQVQAAYITGKTATVQWLTDEPATSEIEYGLTTSYGRTASDGQLVTVHDLTISGLAEATTYHFLVKSKDRDNNISRWYDLTLHTMVTNTSDRDSLIIYDIKPISENDVNVTENSVVISWRTNKLTEGWVRYGKNSNYSNTIATSRPRQFFQSVTLTNLDPGTNYYYQIEVRDVLGKTVKTEGKIFTTKNTVVTATNPPPITSGTVLGASICDVNLKTDFGYFGLYYNLPENHPSIKSSSNFSVGGQNNWYSTQYFSFDRVDPQLDFTSNFFPINGAPYFAVNWRAIIEVPQDGTYTYHVASDDDSWTFIDDQLITDLGGVHSAQDKIQAIQLVAGYHKLEIYYAQRRPVEALFYFRPDARLKFYPLPDGCEISDVVDFNNNLKLPANKSAGKVLGADNADTQTPATIIKKPLVYPCNTNLGYTKILALYKTKASPDIWAILETGQKNYITSPEAFNKYQCDWSAVRIVSQKILDQYTNATLVKTPQDPIIYSLFQRPNHKWLKLNIPSPTIFVSYPNNYWGNVARVDILDIEAYPTAKLIKTKNRSEIYLIDGTSKKQFKSLAVFQNLKYDLAEVVELSQIHLDSFENGSEIQ